VAAPVAIRPTLRDFERHVLDLVAAPRDQVHA